MRGERRRFPSAAAARGIPTVENFLFPFSRRHATPPSPFHGLGIPSTRNRDGLRPALHLSFDSTSEPVPGPCHKALSSRVGRFLPFWATVSIVFFSLLFPPAPEASPAMAAMAQFNITAARVGEH